jgi:nitrate reductase gamma subunit
VRDAATHFSTLFRAEVELAKAEVTAEVRKGLKGSVFFAVALSILLFSLFFLFISVAEALAVWLPRWAAFSIVFGLMLVAAAGFALLGWRRVRSIRKPERTISSLRDTAAALIRRRGKRRTADQRSVDAHGE